MIENEQNSLHMDVRLLESRILPSADVKRSKFVPTKACDFANNNLLTCILVSV